MTFKTKGKKFITLEKAGVRLTKKEFEEGKARFQKFSKSLDNKFRHIRSQEQKKKLPKFEVC
jgi:hypothetical protein